MVKSKEDFYDLARSRLAWDGAEFPSLSHCFYHDDAFCKQLAFSIGDRHFTFVLDVGNRLRLLEEQEGFVFRCEGTLEDGWTSCRRYDLNPSK